jgi:hypothetical protein
MAQYCSGLNYFELDSASPQAEYGNHLDNYNFLSSLYYEVLNLFNLNIL